MTVIWSKNDVYRRTGYGSEGDLEQSILQVQAELFGPSRIYLPVKRKIGLKGGLRNVPDGYLIDLSGQKPQLYVVENEMAAHDLLRHIATQILQFSLSFESEPRTVKSILFNALQEQLEAKHQCERYAASHGFRNLDHFLDWLVFDAPFAALVIIDEVPDNLENVLVKKFNFGVEVLQVARYANRQGECFYHFEPFLADVTADISFSGNGAAAMGTPVSIAEVDTVVVPAREGGFQETFLGENRWHSVRIHGAMAPQIKFIAAYRIRPESAITHIAPVSSIEPWKETNKMVVNFAEPAREIGPIRWSKSGRVKALQNLRYTTRERLEAATTLDDIW